MRRRLSSLGQAPGGPADEVALEAIALLEQGRDAIAKALGVDPFEANDEAWRLERDGHSLRTRALRQLANGTAEIERARERAAGRTCGTETASYRVERAREELRFARRDLGRLRAAVAAE